MADKKAELSAMAESLGFITEAEIDERLKERSQQYQVTSECTDYELGSCFDLIQLGTKVRREAEKKKNKKNGSV